MEDRVDSIRYAMVVFIVPFVFVYKPEVLLLGTWQETLLEP